MRSSRTSSTCPRQDTSACLDCAVSASRTIAPAGEVYSALAPERRLWRGLRSLRRRSFRPAARPEETFPQTMPNGSKGRNFAVQLVQGRSGLGSTPAFQYHSGKARIALMRRSASALTVEFWPLGLSTRAWSPSTLSVRPACGMRRYEHHDSAPAAGEFLPTSANREGLRSRAFHSCAGSVVTAGLRGPPASAAIRACSADDWPSGQIAA
jgi:hypothetical protein